MDDGDVAGEQVRELREKEGRAQVAHQALVEEDARVVRLRQAGEDLAVDRVVALAAAGGDDELHAALQGRILLGARGVEGEARGVAAEPLPGLHLPLIGFLRDLPVPFQRADGVDRKGREGVRIRFRGAAARKRRQMRLQAFSGAGDETDPRDDHIPHQTLSSRRPMRRA